MSCATMNWGMTSILRHSPNHELLESPLQRGSVDETTHIVAFEDNQSAMEMAKNLHSVIIQNIIVILLLLPWNVITCSYLLTRGKLEHYSCAYHLHVFFSVIVFYCVRLFFNSYYIWKGLHNFWNSLHIKVVGGSGTKKRTIRCVEPKCTAYIDTCTITLLDTSIILLQLPPYWGNM